ncbi:MAG: nodulation efficiency protein D (NfeD) [Bacteroidaceae bacterium]|jgi:membrane-bound ClpP family serine protease|nr:nodulation efficiency protein D (NfeD) [Bacteroidaceae bacterium]
MGILFIIALVISALLLLLVELFVIPGSSLAAILSAICLTWAVAYAFINISALAGIITLIIALILGSCVLTTFMRSKTLDKVALTEEVSSTVDRSVAAQVQVGDKGYAVTRLALIGNAEINGHVVEVRSADGFLNEKTPVVVTCVTDNEIIVQKIKNS